MGLHEFMAFLPMGIGFLVWLALAGYLLVLATRLVRAVEQIARNSGN